MIIRTHLRYPLAVVFVIISVLCRLALMPLLDIDVPFLTYFPAVMIAGLVGGFGPGLASLVLSLVAVSLVEGRDLGAHEWSRPSFWTQVLFALAGLLVVWVADRGRQLVVDLEHARQQAVAAALLAEGVLGSLGDAIIAVDREGRTLYANDPALRLANRTRTEVLGRPWEDSWAIFGEQARTTCREAMLTRTARQFEEVDDNLDRTLDVKVNPSADGGLSLRVSDVSDARRAQRARAADERDLRAAPQAVAGRPVTPAFADPEPGRVAAPGASVHDTPARDVLLSVFSHELRTSLNAILGWSEVLRMSAHDPDQVTAAADVIKRNARAQAQLITSLLDADALVSGRVELDRRPMDAVDVAHRAAEAFRPRAEAARVSFVASTPLEPAPVVADPARLDQLIGSLLDHALHDTPAGGSINLAVVAAPHGGLEIVVSDTGAGIPPESLSSVFDTFTKSSAPRRAATNRLGLTIVKHVVELHGGTIGASSPGLDRGTTITVHLPAGIAEPTGAEASCEVAEAPAAASPDVRLQGLNVLVLDDDRESRAHLERILEDAGARVIVASRALEALGLLADDAVHVIVSDVALPEIDGHEFIRQVRTHATGHNGAPAIALTAHAHADERRRALLAGFQVHMTKPVDAAQLRMAVHRLATLSRAAGLGPS